MQALEARLDLRIRWVIPRHPTDHRTCFARMLTSLFDYQGSGSLLAVLKQKGWVHYLGALVEAGDTQEGYEYFAVTMALTWQGWGTSFPLYSGLKRR